MISEDSDGFKVVKYKTRHQGKIQLKTNRKSSIVECDSIDEIINKTNTALKIFEKSQFYHTLFGEIKKTLHTLDLNGIVDIICYGLGNFSEHISSKYQLTALLSIKSVYNSNVFIYDPLFTKNEIECLKQLNLQVLDNNEKGKRVINDCSTLVFMPHCSKQLTNNFLYANWNPLIHNCILLGNSWSELEYYVTDALLKKTTYFVSKLKPYVTEFKLKNNFEYSNTFSGTSLHIFTKDKLNKIPSNFWNKTPDLLSSENDPEFISDE